MTFWAIVIGLWIVLNFPGLKMIFCFFGWHTWEYKSGGHRECKHCGKRQSAYKVGKDTGWH